MTALVAFQPKFDQPKLRPSVPTDIGETLDALRAVALECRAAQETDLFEACALLTLQKEQARDSHAHALLRCLRHALAKSVVFYRPGTREMSFDEAWLTQALSAKKRGDLDSFSFLIKSRVVGEHQRNVAFLINGIARNMA